MCRRPKRRRNGNRPRRVGAPLQKALNRKNAKANRSARSEFRPCPARANLAFKIVYFIVGRVRKSDFYESMMRVDLASFNIALRENWSVDFFMVPRSKLYGFWNEVVRDTSNKEERESRLNLIFI